MADDTEAERYGRGTEMGRDVGGESSEPPATGQYELPTQRIHFAQRNTKATAVSL